MSGPPSIRPPVYRRPVYRFLGARVPYPYWYWVRDDVLGRWYLTRQIACNLVIVVIFQFAILLGLPWVFLAREGE